MQSQFYQETKLQVRSTLICLPAAWFYVSIKFFILLIVSFSWSQGRKWNVTSYTTTSLYFPKIRGPTFLLFILRLEFCIACGFCFIDISAFGTKPWNGRKWVNSHFQRRVIVASLFLVGVGVEGRELLLRKSKGGIRVCSRTWSFLYVKWLKSGTGYSNRYTTEPSLRNFSFN